VSALGFAQRTSSANVLSQKVKSPNHRAAMCTARPDNNASWLAES